MSKKEQLPPEPNRKCWVCLCVLIWRTITTADRARAKSIVIKTWGYEKMLVTVTLVISADGSTLSPHVILNHKTMAKEQLPRGITVIRQLKSMEDWLLVVLKRWPGAHLRKHGMLVLGAFERHLTPKIRATIIG
jgi:hypothetical protein